MNRRIGVIGCGKQAYKHIPALKKLGCEVIVTDEIEKSALQVASDLDVKSIHYDDLIDDTSIKAVTICTPTPTHNKIIFDLIEARKHFFCEKPLARNFEEAQEIKDIYEEKKSCGIQPLIGMVGYLYRFHPAFVLVKELISNRIIGKPYFATFRLGGRGSHREWKHKQNGGAVNEMMVHMLDLILWYFGSIKKTETILFDTVLKERKIEDKRTKVSAEDLALVYLETKDDVKIVCESDLITTSYMNHIEIQGTNGSIITSILDYLPSIVYCIEPRGSYQMGNNFLNFPKVNLFEKQLEYFLECVEFTSLPDRNTIEESIYLSKITDKIKTYKKMK